MIFIYFVVSLHFCIYVCAVFYNTHNYFAQEDAGDAWMSICPWHRGKKASKVRVCVRTDKNTFSYFLFLFRSKCHCEIFLKVPNDDAIANIYCAR